MQSQKVEKPTIVRVGKDDFTYLVPTIPKPKTDEIIRVSERHESVSDPLLFKIGRKAGRCEVMRKQKAWLNCIWSNRCLLFFYILIIGFSALDQIKDIAGLEDPSLLLILTECLQLSLAGIALIVLIVIWPLRRSVRVP